MLTPPDYPEEMEYLREWTVELHGRCGANMGGLNPLSHSEILAWSVLRDVEILPHEVAALLLLDSAMSWPGSGNEEH